MSRPRTRALLLALAALALPLPVAALPLSIGVTTQLQLGWQVGSSTGARLTRLGSRGTSGSDIQPADGSGSFALYGSAFEPIPGRPSFEYGSTLGDTTTISGSRGDSFGVFAGQSTVRQATSPAPLGYFDTGNSVFGQSSRRQP